MKSSPIKWRPKRLRENPQVCCKGNEPEWTVETLKPQTFGKAEGEPVTITTVQCPGCNRNIAGTSAQMAISCWNHLLEIVKRE